MSQIDYADPEAAPPELGPVGLRDGEADDTLRRRVRLAAALPLGISLTAHWVFFIAYWIPETSTFPAHQWWLSQLTPLVSKGLTSDGHQQVPVQVAHSGLPGALLLICAVALLVLSRTRYWWARTARAAPLAAGFLVTLVTFGALVIDETLRTSAVGFLLMVVWVGAAAYAVLHGPAPRPVEARDKTWRSGLGFLVGYAVIGPAPVAVARCLFVPDLRDAAAGLQANTVAFRLAGLLTPGTALLYLAGLMVGVTVWIAHLWFPPRRRLASLWLSGILAGSMLFTGWLAWPANTVAQRRTTVLLYASPAVQQRFPCGSYALQPDPAAPDVARTALSTGFRCRHLTVFAGYRQVVTVAAPDGFSPVKASTPEGVPIRSRLVAAQYGDVLVAATSDRFDGRVSSLVAVGLADGTLRWTYTCPGTATLALRFAAVPAGEAPDLGHVTLTESRPRVVVRCADRTVGFDPTAGPG